MDELSISQVVATNNTPPTRVCDFCSEPVTPGQDGAFVYPAHDFTIGEAAWASTGAWLACATCAAFIRQFDGGEGAARLNLARRAIGKYHRRYGLRGALESDPITRSYLTAEVHRLHGLFWHNRYGVPTPYSAAPLLEG